MTTEKKMLEKLVAKKDPKVRFGEPYKYDDVITILMINEETSDFEETGKVMCVPCGKLLSMGDGGQLKRHKTSRCKSNKRKASSLDTEPDSEEPTEKNRKIVEFTKRKFKESQIKGITRALSKYCLKSGRSYNHMGSDMMKTFVIDVVNSVAPGHSDFAQNQLPCRQSIQKISEEMSKELISKAHTVLLPFVKKQRVNLLLDHGKLVVNYLSVYASYLTDNFDLQIIPLAFIPSTEGKSGADTYRCVKARLMEYGWSPDEIESCCVTADGALGTLSGYFRKYIRCVSHSINLLGSHGLEPAEFQRKKLDNTDLEILEKCSEVMRWAGIVSSGIRSNSDLCAKLTRLPALIADTRWLSGLKCLKDILDMLKEIEENEPMLSAKTASAFNKMKAQLQTANSIVHVFEPLLKFNNVYQTQSAVTLHLVLPSFKILEKKWRLYEMGTFEDCDSLLFDEAIASTLSKNGLIALQKYYNEFSDVHFAAVMLSPRTKKMTQFSKEEYAKAKNFIHSLLPATSDLKKAEMPSKEIGGVRSLELLISDENEEECDADTEFSRYMSEHVDFSSTESLENYWGRKSNEYPSLFSVALSVYATVPSESICETCFSIAGFMLDKRRTRLQYSRAELIVVGAQLAAKFPSWLDNL